MPLERLLSALVLLAACAATASAQQELSPGSRLLRTDRVVASVDTFTITNYRAGAAWRTSKLVRGVERVTENGRHLLRFAQRYDTPDGVSVDTTWVDAATLEPVRYFADIITEVHRLNFTPNEARGTVTPKDSASRPVVHSAPTPFFNAVAIELLYFSVTFAPGVSVAIDAYNPPRMTLRIPLSYVGTERLPLMRGGTIEAVKVSFNNTSHVWLDAKTGALLLNGGARPGGVAFWKVRSDIDASKLVAASLK